MQHPILGDLQRLVHNKDIHTERVLAEVHTIAETALNLSVQAMYDKLNILRRTSQGRVGLVPRNVQVHFSKGLLSSTDTNTLDLVFKSLDNIKPYSKQFVVWPVFDTEWRLVYADVPRRIIHTHNDKDNRQWGRALRQMLTLYNKRRIRNNSRKCDTVEGFPACGWRYPVASVSIAPIPLAWAIVAKMAQLSGYIGTEPTTIPQALDLTKEPSSQIPPVPIRTESNAFTPSPRFDFDDWNLDQALANTHALTPDDPPHVLPTLPELPLTNQNVSNAPNDPQNPPSPVLPNNPPPLFNLPELPRNVQTSSNDRAQIAQFSFPT
jgi:hypothetical protein